MTRPTYPIVTTALRVEQPLGIFYVVSLPATVVLEVAYNERLSAFYSEETKSYSVTGIQRGPQEQRIDAITRYVKRVDAAFPNAIILAGNAPQPPELTSQSAQSSPVGSNTQESSEATLGDDYAGDGNSPDDADDERNWAIAEGPEGHFQLTIPTAEKMANIIDGQHRLFGIAQAPVESIESIGLVCAIFLDLPKPFQAQLFAIINSTQKPVDKSLTYEQFGYNTVDEDHEMWTPDKLAVFLSRRLAVEPESPLYSRIIIAPKKDKALEAITGHKSWRVSTATVVQGISRLYSSNPGRDATEMLTGKRKSRAMIRDFRYDRSPLRQAYIEGNDLLIYTMTVNFLRACDEVFWQKQPTSFITRTVGIQALFDILRRLVPRAEAAEDIRTGWFKTQLDPAADIDFNAPRFNASGSGRSLISREIRARIGLT